jgi:hypothetical protein
MAYKIATKHYGELLFKRVFYGASNKEAGTKGGCIGILDNGVWCHHPSGHPLGFDEGIRILQEVDPSQVPAFKAWFERREEEETEAELNAPRPIEIGRDGILRFEDGEKEEVIHAADVFAFYQAGSRALEMALELFQERRVVREQSNKVDLLSKDRPGSTNLDQAFGRTRAGREQPSTDPRREEEIRQKRLQNLEKARAARERKKAVQEQFKAREEKPKEEVTV